MHYTGVHDLEPGQARVWDEECIHSGTFFVQSVGRQYARYRKSDGSTDRDSIEFVYLNSRSLR